ncbi:ankyrin repeat domain-containing protein [Campylobacter geochelonis]|nr:ankyrin repeat domain-containing protein [Campylobacter geochelonis]QKF71492.1 ankyrin domain-containing protein [Campylobacter geochelonis]
MKFLKEIIVIVVVGFLFLVTNDYYKSKTKQSNFVVYPNMKVDSNSPISKYVTQEEINAFSYENWDIDDDGDHRKENDLQKQLRRFLKTKQTVSVLNFIKDNNLSVDMDMLYGLSPLMYSSFYDDEVTSKELIKLGADINKKDKYNLSSLAYAIENNSTKTVKLLLDNGAKFNEIKTIQAYLGSPNYNLIKNITINKNNIDIKYEAEYGKKYIRIYEDSKGNVSTDYYAPESSLFEYIVYNNFLEIAKMLLESGYKPFTYRFTNDINDLLPSKKDGFYIDINDSKNKNEIDYLKKANTHYNILTYIPNYEPMLELMLKYNVPGQPTKEQLKEAYDECYDDYIWHKSRLENKKPKEIYFSLRAELSKNMCSDENGTFNDIKEYMEYKNKRKLTDSIVYVIRANKVILKDKSDTIYNKINTINQKKFID